MRSWVPESFRGGCSFGGEALLASLLHNYDDRPKLGRTLLMVKATKVLPLAPRLTGRIGSWTSADINDDAAATIGCVASDVWICRDNVRSEGPWLQGRVICARSLDLTAGFGEYLPRDGCRPTRSTQHGHLKPGWARDLRRARGIDVGAPCLLVADREAKQIFAVAARATRPSTFVDSRPAAKARRRSVSKYR